MVALRPHSKRVHRPAGIGRFLDWRPRLFQVLLEGSPAHIDMHSLWQTLEDVEGVTLVHDIHAWTITSGYELLTAHVLVAPDYPGELATLRRRLQQIAYHDFGIGHITLQMEQSLEGCTEATTSITCLPTLQIDVAESPLLRSGLYGGLLGLVTILLVACTNETTPMPGPAAPRNNGLLCLPADHYTRSAANGEAHITYGEARLPAAGVCHRMPQGWIRRPGGHKPLLRNAGQLRPHWSFAWYDKVHRRSLPYPHVTTLAALDSFWSEP